MIAPPDRSAATRRTAPDDGAGSTTTALQTCPLCEAACGLTVTIRNQQPVRIRGDAEDPQSSGFLCPKGASLISLHDDPDRLRRPLVRIDGELRDVGWDEAWEYVVDLVDVFVERHGRSALGTYVGNPSAHNLSLLFYAAQVLRAVGGHSHFSSASVDTLPKQFAAAQMFGNTFTMPVPDVNRTQHLLIIGANPLVSNGSVLTAPNMSDRLAAIRQRGGRVIVIDPRRTKTAEAADEHHFIIPGTDVWLLAAMVRQLFVDGLVHPGAAAEHVTGLDALATAVEPFTAELAEQHTGIDREVIIRLAVDLAAAPSAVVYGRIGTCLQEHGTVASWLIDTLNILTGNLDEPGGAVFTMPVTERRRTRRWMRSQQSQHGRWTSRVDELPEMFGELPSAALARDILEPGDGRIRGLVTIAGNPALSVPDSNLMESALSSLDLLICVDSYLNETTRHADVVLPGESPLQRPHFPFIARWSLQRYSRWTPGTLPPDPDRPREWEMLLQLAGVLSGQRGPIDPAQRDDELFDAKVRREVADPMSTLWGRDPDEIVAGASGRGPERLVDLLVRTGIDGDGFRSEADGLSLEALRESPHGIVSGPIERQLPDVVCTVSGLIEMAPDMLVQQLRQIADTTMAARDDEHPLLLIGRRNLRSNNSWMHNLPSLVRGRPQATLLMHPLDAAAAAVDHGDAVTVTSSTGVVDTVVELTTDISQGVVSLPHGWGHGRSGTRLQVAATVAGSNSNALGNITQVDRVTMTSVSSGIPVAVHRTIGVAPVDDDTT